MGDMEAGNEALVINIGAKTTNLLFINQTGYLIRTIAIGGNTMSQSISDSLGITFEKAESLKKAYFSGEIKLAEDDASKTAISNANNQFLARASQEITRSVVTIKRLKKGQSPKTIYLTGRGAFLPGLNEYLQETQQINVQYFNPLIGLKISNNVPEKYMVYFLSFWANQLVWQDSYFSNLQMKKIKISICYQKIKSHQLVLKRKHQF
jgi:type IV pilus assembly protein PilM